MNQEEILVRFLIYLNEKDLINDYDFDYEVEVQEFLEIIKEN